MSKEIVIFEIKNCQEDYAACLEFIKICEGKIVDEKRNYQETYNETIKSISIYRGIVDRNVAPRYLEEPVVIFNKQKSRYEEKNIITEKKKLSEVDWEWIGEEHKAIQYYFRIHMKKSSETGGVGTEEFIHLQYLALLLKRLKEWNLFKRDSYVDASVFIVPLSGDRYPYETKREFDENTYVLVSQYLRLLASEYKGKLFGALKEQGKVVIRSFDFKKDRKYENFFPLIVINDELYENLFKEDIQETVYKWIKNSRKNSRFGDSRNKKPKQGIKDVIVETAIRRLGDCICNSNKNDEGWKKKLEHALSILIQENSGSRMQLSFFSFMLHINGEEDEIQLKDNIRNIWQLAGEVCHGIRQIVQNSIQHSEFKECFFSFYLHKNKEKEENIDFIKRIGIEYPETHFKKTEDNKSLEGLEIFISDLNEQSDMTQKFAEILRWEKETAIRRGKRLRGHEELCENENFIAIRNFFSEFSENDEKDSWYQFRCQDLVGHIGLSLFAVTAKRCNASVKVISSKNSCLSDDRNYFYKAYSTDDRKMFRIKKRHIIPGTQFSILIPIQKWESNFAGEMGQLCSNSYAMEDYKSFADFIQHKVKRRYITENVDSTWDMNAKSKYEWVQRWAKYWEKHILDNLNYLSQLENKCEKIIFNHDLSKVSEHSFFTNEDNLEVFIKGLIQSLEILSEIEDEYYFAITNVPKGFLRIFQEICIVLCIRQFPRNLQIYLCEKNCENAMILVGNEFSNVVYNSYMISLEQGVKGFNKGDCERVTDLRNQLVMSLSKKSDEENAGIRVCPFDVILRYGEENKTIFERRIEKIAERPLDQPPAGYKLLNTHMRLGSKVHLEAFYEMSFLFYRTTIANRIALLILHNLNEYNEEIDLLNDVVLFYGYASYSKAILTSITEILRVYRKSKNLDDFNVAFSAYQHNLQMDSEKVQMYFALPERFPGRISEDNKLELMAKKKIKLVQIVPISSTLTTFKKMLKMFFDTLILTELDKVVLNSNYTVFWVIDEEGNVKNGIPSDIEGKYRDNALHDIRQVRTKSKLEGVEENRKDSELVVNYFMSAAVKWNDPMKCRLCYPDYVIEEIPLVETDPTSTVPAQQIRYQQNKFDNSRSLKTEDESNMERLLKLKECVYYGHIYRRQNHYQYYIDTQKYFYEVKTEVMRWLHNQDENVQKAEDMLMHVIFSPEHNTNVGFAQYVNTYYFNGMAEIVSFNVDKQFRSNFQCEHAALKGMIEKLHKDTMDTSALPVKFYFVDDTIITGETFRKSNSFLHSLIPEEEREKYPANLFEKVFLLIDRLSDATKQTYVEKIDKNFLSFLHIDISNVRTQGDSCIGCKMEQNARRMFKRSATGSQATYWIKKLKYYHSVAYDNKEEMNKISTRESFEKLLISHILQNVIIKRDDFFRLGVAYDAFLNLTLWMLMSNKEWKIYCDDNKLSTNERNIYGYKLLLEQVSGIKGVQTLLKISSRPFFTYDFKVRMQILTLSVFLSELLLGKDMLEIIPKSVKKNRWKSFIFENRRRERTVVLAKKISLHFSNSKDKLTFFRDCLFLGLTDLGSTYLMRKRTIMQVYQWLENDRNVKINQEDKKEFWKSYSTNIYRLVTNNADETKELWLEYLYLCGNEYQALKPETWSDENIDKFKARFLVETITGENFDKEKGKYFFRFCHELFLQNTGINFDNIEKGLPQEILENCQTGKEYSLDYWIKFRKLSQLVLGMQGKRIFTEAENEFFNMMKELLV